MNKKITTTLEPRLTSLLRPKQVAIIVIDVMDGYCRPDSPLGRYLVEFEGADYSDLDKAADRMVSFLDASRKFPIATTVFVRMEEKRNTQPESIRLKMDVAEEPDVTEKDGEWWGYYKVKPESGDLEIIKYRQDAFLGTDLDEHLKSHGVRTVVICGGHASTCVDTTARTAAQLGYHTFVPADMTADVSPAGSTHTPDDVRGKLYVINNVMGYMPLSSEVLSAWE